MSSQKNILLISMDDAVSYWRYKSVFGAQLLTPNLDRICAVSSAFTSAYCQVPVCGPSRASVMSGLSPHKTGVFDNYTSAFDVLRPEQFWQHRLKRDGYICATAGKIHHGFKPLPDDIHDTLYSHKSRRVHFGPKKDAPHEKFGGRSDGRGTTDPIDDRKYFDFRSAQDGIRFLKRHTSEAPFYREVGFHHPHAPFRTPIRFKEMYDVEAFTPPQEWEHGFESSDFTRSFMQENMETAADLDLWRRSLRNYFSAISHVDHEIGRVWDALQASRHAKDTVVVIFSDHGFHLGDKNRFRKFTLWEEAACVPLIIHDPDTDAQVIDDPVSLLDIGPTILDYARIDQAAPLAGQSLRSVVKGERQERRAIPTFWYGSASVRTGDHRVTLYQDGSSEFYNIKDDPWQTRNLAGISPDYDPALRQFYETCKNHGLTFNSGEFEGVGVNHFISHIGQEPPAVGLPTNGLISTGSITAHAKVPGYRRQFAMLKENATLHVPDGVDELFFIADACPGVSKCRVVCNQSGTKVRLKTSHKRLTVEITGGAGDDEIFVSHDGLIANLTAGNNLVHAGVSDAKIFGGTGKDIIHAVAGQNVIHGGSGNAVIYGGLGNDRVYSGTGVNVIESGPGDNLIVLEGGTNRSILGDGCNHLVFYRTGLPQTVNNLTEKTNLEFFGWDLDQAFDIHADGSDIVATHCLDQIVFADAKVDLVRALLAR